MPMHDSNQRENIRMQRHARGKKEDLYFPEPSPALGASGVPKSLNYFPMPIGFFWL